MANLATALRAEIRKLAKSEADRVGTRVSRLERQVRELRQALRAERRRTASLERRLTTLRRRIAQSSAHEAQAPAMSPQAIRALRGPLPRVRFAKLLGVSPGSIFGWETGRSVPRGRNFKRLAELERLGLPALGAARRTRAAAPRKRRRRS